MKSIKEPRWRAIQAGSWPHQIRPVADIGGHPIIMNASVEAGLLDRALEAFEIADKSGDILGVVWSTEKQQVGEYAERYKSLWHSITTDLVTLPNAGSRQAAAAALLSRERMARKERRKHDEDMAAIADLDI